MKLYGTRIDIIFKNKFKIIIVPQSKEFFYEFSFFIWDIIEIN